MRLPAIRSWIAFALMVASAEALAQAPLCTPLPGSLVEIGDSTQPNYIGISFSYNQSQNAQDMSQASGITIGDYNNDGFEDIVIAGGLNQKILLGENQKNGTFLDVAAARGLTNTQQRGGATLLFDYDNDGDLDLFDAAHLTNSGVQLFRLYRNSGTPGNYQFYDVTPISDLKLDTATVKQSKVGILSGITTGDYDQDGYLDLFVCWWNTFPGGVQNDMWRLFQSQPNPNSANNVSSVPTNTPRVFVDRTIAAGLNIDLDQIPDPDGGPKGGDTWQPTFVDLDNDGWPDLHVNLDFGADFMLMNQRDGTFVNVASAIGLNGDPPQARNEMGAYFADVDNDGDLDVHLTNLAIGDLGSTTNPKVWRDRFYRNDSSNGHLKFVDMAPIVGVNDSEVGWGTLAFDYDNDGDLDQAFVTGMRLIDDPFLNPLFINQFPMKASDGKSPLYCDATALVPQFSKTPLGDDVSRNLEPLDFDNDGDLDLIVGKSQDITSTVPIQRFEFFSNTQNTGNDWIKIDLRDAGNGLNTENARLWLRTAGVTQHHQVIAGMSFHGQDSARQHFGLGPQGGSKLKWLVVRWPGKDGNFQYVESLLAGRINAIARTHVDSLGDVNADGKIDATDLSYLAWMVFNPVQFATTFPDSPGQVLGDMDQDNDVDPRDLLLLQDKILH